MTFRLFLRLLLTTVGGSAASVLPAAESAALADHAVRAQVAGIDTIAYRTDIQDVVTLTGSLPAGDAYAPADNVAIATLTGELLAQGTRRHDKFQIAQQLEQAGAELSFGVDNHVLFFNARCLRKDLPMVIALLAEQLREPAFTDEEHAKMQTQLEGAMRRQLEDTNATAAIAFARAIYSEGHPNRPADLQTFIKDIGRATPSEIRHFHKTHYGPAGMIVVAVGDLDPLQFQQELAKQFAGWEETSTRPLPPANRRPPQAAVQTVAMADKTSVSIVLGAATGLRYTDPDVLALRLGTAVLGSGFTSRLVGIVRDREGLTYGISARVADDTFTDGAWQITATFSPGLLEQGIGSTRRELQRWYDDGITEKEFRDRQSNLIGSYKVGLSTTEGLASTLLRTVQRGLPLSWLDEYPQRVAALTREEVNQAVRQHLDPSLMVLVQAGTLPNTAAKDPAGR